MKGAYHTVPIHGIRKLYAKSAFGSGNRIKRNTLINVVLSKWKPGVIYMNRSHTCGCQNSLHVFRVVDMQNGYGWAEPQGKSHRILLYPFYDLV